MSMVQNGPPQWVWERTADPLKWDVVPFQDPKGHTVYEVRVSCGLEIMRLQFFTADELGGLQSVLSAIVDTSALVLGRR
jgi:hypothetical protein